MIKAKKSLCIFAICSIIFLMLFSILYFFNRKDDYLRIFMLTPTISVILARMISREGLKGLYLRPNLKGNIKWYLSAYFLTPVIAYLGACLYFLVFKREFDLLGSFYAVKMCISNEKEYIKVLCTMIPLAMVVNPLMGLIQAFGEEFAWRGYLLPKLEKVFHFQIRKAVIMNGFIWGIWHSPFIAMGYNYGIDYPLLGVMAMIIFCTIVGIIESYLFYKTKSVWCPSLFHASMNAINTWRPSLLFMSTTPNFFWGPDLGGFIGGIGFIIMSGIIFLFLPSESGIKWEDR